ncbi:aminodeoxychorismate lyase [Methylococcus sp. EFPC2]|uniref:aminodeoxychorismate lyase n=1 Tax=Methylococcus sp. EFPC2 TaxID=2812648 RepID=UPI00196732AE|nr:aminodeoxychorismate lyase [Methylococcus sp. EFPC2]QSA97395.1 aminodeoxychorismate lyase [Methylococcus sp. EFPC2]
MPHAGSVLINGFPERTVDIADRGFQYGDGIFTTLAVSRGLPLFLSEHLERLQRDAVRLGMESPDPELLAGEVARLAVGVSAGVIKIILTRGSGGRGYRVPVPAQTTRVVSLHPYPAIPSSRDSVGIAVRLCRLRLAVQPRLAGVKHLNRLEQVLARAEWEDETILEGLLLDVDGHVVEGVMSNLFVVKDGVVRTPLLDRCGVSGVMRGVVIRLATALHVPVAETRLGLEEIYDADELFLTNSVTRIRPIGRFESRDYRPGPLTGRLIAQLDAHIESEIARACGA